MNFEAFVSIQYGSFPFEFPSSVLDRSTLLFSSIRGQEHSKTIANVTDWMLDSCKESFIQQDDWGQLAADGGSNAIGSIREFELVTGFEDGGRESSVDFNICYSHQNERSGGYASGTVQFSDSQNDVLGGILKKSHGIQVRINQSHK